MYCMYLFQGYITTIYIKLIIFMVGIELLSDILLWEVGETRKLNQGITLLAISSMYIVASKSFLVVRLF